MWWFCCLLGALKNKTDSRTKLFLNEAYMIFPVLTLQWAQTASPQSADVGFQMCLQSAKASPCCWGPGQSPLHHPGSSGTGGFRHTANLGTQQTWEGQHVVTSFSLTFGCAEFYWWCPSWARILFTHHQWKRSCSANGACNFPLIMRCCDCTFTFAADDGVFQKKV